MTRPKSEDTNDKELENLQKELAELEQLNLTENSNDPYLPDKPEKDSFYRFARDMLDKKDSTKIANVQKNELGTPKITLRAYQDLALYAQAEGLDKVSEYLYNKGEVISKTSMGKEGFWAKLLVTQIKKETKTSESPKKAKRWFSWGRKDDEVEADGTD